MHIDNLLGQARQFSHSPTTMSFPESWAQGRTAFGGLSAALLYSAMQSKVAQGRALRSLTTNFVGPLLADDPFTFEVELLREGKSASQVTGRIIQNSQVVVIQQGCFGNERISDIKVSNSDKHQMPTSDQLPKLPFIPDITPNFLQNFDLAVAGGELPYSNGALSHIDGWMRFKHAPSELTDAHLICLIDTWPPCVLQMMKKPAPVSTMMWNLEFIHPHRPIAPEEWFAYQSNTRQAAGGYAHTEANIWDCTGELVAISRQSIAVFD